VASSHAHLWRRSALALIRSAVSMPGDPREEELRTENLGPSYVSSPFPSPISLVTERVNDPESRSN